MAEVGLTENIGETGLKFEIWFRRPMQDSIVLHSATQQKKVFWVEEVRGILWKQAMRNRGIVSYLYEYKYTYVCMFAVVMRNKTVGPYLAKSADSYFPHYFPVINKQNSWQIIVAARWWTWESATNRSSTFDPVKVR